MFGRKKAAAPSRVPARAASSRTPAVQQPKKSGGMLSGIGSTIAQGMAFGTGSAMAHQAVGAAVGSMSGGGGGEQQQQEMQQPMDNGMQQQQQTIQGACGQDKQMFFECLQVNKGDQQSCSFLYEQLQSCQRSDTSMSFQ